MVKKARPKMATTSIATTAVMTVQNVALKNMSRMKVTCGRNTAWQTTERMKKVLPRCLTTATGTTTYDCDPGDNECDDEGTD